MRRTAACKRMGRRETNSGEKCNPSWCDANRKIRRNQPTPKVGSMERRRFGAASTLCTGRSTRPWWDATGQLNVNCDESSFARSPVELSTPHIAAGSWEQWAIRYEGAMLKSSGSWKASRFRGGKGTVSVVRFRRIRWLKYMKKRATCALPGNGPNVRNKTCAVLKMNIEKL